MESPYLRLFAKQPSYDNLVPLVVYVLFIYFLISDINYLLKLFDVHYWNIMCQKGFVCYDPTLHQTRISRNVIFENQHFFLVSSLYCGPSLL